MKTIQSIGTMDCDVKQEISQPFDIMDCDVKQEEESPIQLGDGTSSYIANETGPNGNGEPSANVTNTPAGEIPMASIELQPLDSSLHGKESLLIRTINKKNRKIRRLETKIRRRHGPVIIRTHTRYVEDKTRITNQEAEISKLTDQLSYQIREADDYAIQNKNLQDAFQEEFMRGVETEKMLQKASQKADVAEEQLAKLRQNFQDTIQTLKAENNMLKRQDQMLSLQLASQKAIKTSTQPYANSGKVSDGAIMRIWKKMKYSIHNITSTLLTTCPSEDAIKNGNSKLSRILQQLTPRQIQFLHAEDTTSSVVERCIWNEVTAHVFKHNKADDFGGIWAGNVGENFSTIIHELQQTICKRQMKPNGLFQWKSEGGRVIEEMMGVDKEKLREVVREETGAFSHFLPDDKVGQEATMTKLYNALYKVFEDAVQLHAVFMSSKAHFCLEHPRPPVGKRVIRYDPESMDAEVWEKEPVNQTSAVRLSISPGLVKVGTADGDHYDQRLRLDKARVICN